MNCNKCGTPILPGEHICRFCGAIDDFSKREKEDIDHEIIDFTAGEDDVVIIDDDEDLIPPTSNNINNTSKFPPIDFGEVIKTIDVTQNENNMAAPVVNNIKEDEISKITEPPVLTPIAPVIDTAINETPVVPSVSLEKEAVVNVENKDVSMAEPIVITEAPKNGTDSIVEGINDQQNIVTEFNSNKKNDNKNSGGKKNIGLFNILTFVLLLLLVGSVILNCFLLMGNSKDNKEVEDKPVVSATNAMTYFSNYKMEIPSNWITVKDENSFLKIMDNTENWAASINIVVGTDASLVSKNSTNITNAFGNNKYLFTSEYSKTINNKDFYIFKGKYLDYSVYVITSDLNGNTVVADLKFKGEVDENVVSSLLNSITTIDSKDLTLFYNNNFEFMDVTSLIRDNALPVSNEDENALGVN